MEPWLDATIFGIAFFFMLIGLVGLIIPLFPGVLVMWVAALIYGITVGFNTLGIILFVLITIVAIAASLVDNVLTGAGAVKSGAVWWTSLLGMLAGVIFTLIWPPIGGVIATPLVVLLLEYLRQKDWKKALTALKGAVIGWALSFVARFILGLFILGLWVVWALFK